MTERSAARWQPLPDSLSPAALLLVQHLRALKQRTGLSLAALATRTAHSKSAWHRYLNGVKFPPRTAVEALGRLAGAELASLLMLWEDACRAETAPTNAVPAGAAPAAAPPVSTAPAAAPPVRTVPVAASPQPHRPDGRGRQMRRSAAALVLSATLGAVACAMTVPALPDGGAGRPGCHGRSCQGQDATDSRCDRDARTESMVAFGSHAVRLRFSPSCATVWADVSTGGHDGAAAASIRSASDELVTARPGGTAHSTSSPMLPAASPRGAEACAEIARRLTCTGALQLSMQLPQPR
ncbi:DUF2690 domain-containing protein [Streptomyces sp. NPDC002004]